MSGINAKRENRIKGIVDRISSEDDFDSIKWITQAPVQNFCRSAVDEIAQKNAELHNDMGLEAKIVRQTVGENCKWCDALAGEYVYPDVPKEVYQRHDDCDCIVEYHPGDGRKQDVWGKQWTEAPEDLEARKDYNMPQKDAENTELKNVVPNTPTDTGVPNDAAEYYVSGDGMWINDYLRGLGDFGDLNADERIYLSELDNATNGLIGETTVYRSVDASAIFGNISDIEYENLIDAIVYGDTGPFATEVREKFLKNIEGKKILDKGFVSTTKDYDVAKEWGGFTGSDKPVVLEIKTAKNTKGVDLSIFDKNVSADEAQKEILLAREQTMQIMDVVEKDGNILIKILMR